MSSNHSLNHMAMSDIKNDQHCDTDEIDGHHNNDHLIHNSNTSTHLSHNDDSTRTGSTVSMDGHHRSMEQLRRHSVHRSNRNLERSHDDVDPLLETENVPKQKPPLADAESSDDSNDEDHPNTSNDHPGVDDGFFPDTTNHHHPKSDDDHPDDRRHHGHVPHNGGVPRRKPSFPILPEYDGGEVTYDEEGKPIIIPDVNVYQHKKTLAQGMMDLALLSANANQLRYVLESSSRHPYYYLSLVFISMSLILQVVVGIGLILNSRYNVKRDDHICKANKVNDLTVLGIFLITIVNVFITSFGVADGGSS